MGDMVPAYCAIGLDIWGIWNRPWPTYIDIDVWIDFLGSRKIYCQHVE